MRYYRPPPVTIRIAIVDDHTLFRQALRRMLETERQVEVVGEGGSATEAIRLAADQGPDVVIVDLFMPDDGLRAVSEIARLYPRTRTLVVTAADEAAALEAALAAGANGLVVKSADAATLLEAVRTVHAGHRYIGPEAIQLLSNEGPASELHGLSPREQEVLRGITRGFTNREMAEQMGVSVKTVEGYRARLRTKLGVDTRAELVELAQRMRSGSKLS